MKGAIPLSAMPKRVYNKDRDNRRRSQGTGFQAALLIILIRIMKRRHGHDTTPRADCQMLDPRRLHHFTSEIQIRY